jgi:hypothetical protein
MSKLNDIFFTIASIIFFLTFGIQIVISCLWKYH